MEYQRILQVYGDSQLVIRQVNDNYQTKDDRLLPYKRMVDDLKKNLQSIMSDHIPRV